jgi:hypothetical protein
MHIELAHRTMRLSAIGRSDVHFEGFIPPPLASTRRRRMADPAANQIRTLIRQNEELEQRLRNLQVAIAGIRADFEAVMHARIHQLDPGRLDAPAAPHAPVASKRQVSV